MRRRCPGYTSIFALVCIAAAAPDANAAAQQTTPARTTPARTAAAQQPASSSGDRAGHPGFDTRKYPGDAALRTWRTASPYEWTSYYLVSPCQKGSTWSGKRETVRAIGYGIAVVFLGEQDWPVDTKRDTSRSISTSTSASASVSVSASAPAPAVRRDTTAAAANTPKQCTAANLTAAKGAIDAARADSTAAAEGFPTGTVVYLDIERAETISAPFEEYIRAYIRGMLRSTRYSPGVYVHEKNAEAVHAIGASEYARAGHAKMLPFWVAATTGNGTPFDLSLAPTASGYSYATIWQGVFNTAQTWGGVTITIDADVAASADPSGGR